MDIEISDDGPLALRITLEAGEIHLLQRTLERACYLDTPPGEQAAVLDFAEFLLKTLQQLPGAEAGGDDQGGR